MGSVASFRSIAWDEVVNLLSNHFSLDYAELESSIIDDSYDPICLAHQRLSFLGLIPYFVWKTNTTLPSCSSLSRFCRCMLNNSYLLLCVASCTTSLWIRSSPNFSNSIFRMHPRLAFPPPKFVTSLWRNPSMKLQLDRRWIETMSNRL